MCCTQEVLAKVIECLEAGTDVRAQVWQSNEAL